jgi:uncharacterized Zn finger protein (UPF0148 family)
MILDHPRLQQWAPPANYQQTESVLTGITVFAPTPTVRTVDQETSFKCPNCGATTRFDVAAGGVACEYCGYTAPVQAAPVGRTAAEFEFTLTTLNQSQNGWGVPRRELHCENCGAELTLPDGAITSTCTFCASNKVNLRTAESEHLRPRFLAPFTIQPDETRQLIRTWLGTGWLHPGALSQSAGIGHMHGVYLPFWTFDSTITSDWQAEVGYPKQERFFDRASKSWKTRTQLEWKWEKGQVTTIIDDMLISGSSHLNQTILHRLYPFDLDHLAEYHPDYLAGWQAHAYDVMLLDAWETAKTAMRTSAKRDCYTSIRDRSSHIRNFSMTADFADEVWRYILLPVYIAAYTFEGNTYQVMINGQSGTVAGQKPVAWWKIWLASAVMLIPAVIVALIGVGLAMVGDADQPYRLFLMAGFLLFMVGVFGSVALYRKAAALESV